ncbi:DUF6655 family protein [Thalassobaculum sp. OXR-137]|uniref:DUF6655 family protein n=1 Tax=Thalassobaculum sp. OXR-137 TaxID=3100173 RepID=UPI002AC97A41|nr:DUF6655 family protein [Thalassobaculum sp. OXR-137]WPZ32623.1 DUF6655 family protein [Thalassobaculum sp. OXR-137]
MTSRTGRLAIPLAILALCTACTESRRSDPERTAEEQLLLSTAVDRAVDGVTLNVPKGTKVFVDASRFEAYDKSYAISAFRDRVLESGAHLVSQLADAQVIVEIRSGALSTDGSRTIVGIPSFDVPIPLAGDLSVPELSLASRKQRLGVAKVAYTAYWRESGALADRSEPIQGVAGYRDWEFIGFGWRSGDTLIQADIPDTLAEPQSEQPEETSDPAATGGDAGR